MLTHITLYQTWRCHLLRASFIPLALMNLAAAQNATTRIYENSLTPIKDPKPLLADYPEFVQPVIESQRFEAPLLVQRACARPEQERLGLTDRTGHRCRQRADQIGQGRLQLGHRAHDRR